MSPPLSLPNKAARRIAIHSAGLSNTPAGDCDKSTLLQLIKNLGYVQLDPLQVVARAHDHILWSRTTSYQPQMLDELLREHSIYEHFCHDACYLPMDTLPYWKNQFKRQSVKRTGSQWLTTLTRKDKNAILKRIKAEGPLRSIDFKSAPETKPKGIWTKPEHKKILDYLWLKGELGVAKRVNFSKYYDLAERIYPSAPTKSNISDAELIDWLSNHALQCLGFASPGEIMRFWEAIDLEKVKKWCDADKAGLQTVNIEYDDGRVEPYLAKKSEVALLTKPTPPTNRLRIINPFDPLVRDRKRLQRLFGFEYRIEIYTPPKQRKYGYYVYPLLEGDSFVGRIEIRHDRKSNELVVDNVWPEDGIKFGKGRMGKLESEVERLRRFCQAEVAVWGNGSRRLL